jgi:hypothetical protein
MAIKIRRGTDTARLAVIFEEGEVIYTTDTKSFFIGDGVTAGGNQIGGTTAASLLKAEVHNATGATLTKGQVVYLNGNTGNKPNAVLAQANSEATSSKTIGLIILNISNNANGDIATDGLLSDLNTSAFVAGDLLWLSDSVAGGVTTIIPDTPNHAVFIGYVVRAHATQGSILIHIQNGYELNEIHDVKITSVANGDVLSYDSTLGYWKNIANSSFTPPNGLLKIASAISTTLQVVKDYLDNASVLFLNSRRIGIGKDTSVTTQSVAVVEVQDTNTSIVLKPNGTGALLLNIPDGTDVGGNARGQYAVDLQRVRNVSDRVASGSFSVISGGERAKASGIYSVVSGGFTGFSTGDYSTVGGGESNTSAANYATISGGQSNTIITSINSTIGGGKSNQITAAAYSTVSGGQSNTASPGTHATISGGQNNQILASVWGTISGGQSNTATSGTHATVIGGQSNTSSGQWGISGGQSSTASGSRSIALGTYALANATGAVAISAGANNTTTASGVSSVSIGNDTNASGRNSLCTGYFSNAYLYGQRSHSGNFIGSAVQGNCQISELNPYKLDTLTTAAITVLSLDGTGTTNLIIPNGNNRAWNVTIDTIAVVTAITGTATGVSVGHCYSETKQLLFKRIGGTSSIVGTVDTSAIKSDSGMSTASITISAGGSQQMAITFTAPTFAGSGSITCRIVSKVMLVEVAY